MKSLNTEKKVSQSWVDKQSYPFPSKYIQLPHGNMHYVDQGEGEVILFVHGTPTWSFLYRDFIKEFSNNYRCIAPDHLGFGLSDKPTGFNGSPESHAENLSVLINTLDLKNITLVVHDFGGPIGLSAAIQNNKRIQKIVLFNTWLWETKNNPDAQKVDKIINSLIGRFLYLYMNFSPKVLLKKGFEDKSKLNKKIHQQYIQAFPDKSSRYGLLNMAKSLVSASDWYQKQWDELTVLNNKPWLILWGMEDQFITPAYLEKWKEKLSDYKVKTYKCGHFVQEEKTLETIEDLRQFMLK